LCIVHLVTQRQVASGALQLPGGRAAQLARAGAADCCILLHRLCRAGLPTHQRAQHLREGNVLRRALLLPPDPAGCTWVHTQSVQLPDFSCSGWALHSAAAIPTPPYRHHVQAEAVPTCGQRDDGCGRRRGRLQRRRIH